ncbi:NADH-quinone oxidoreductase subunit NuoE [Nocardia pseudobrasiliensis]|uniref:NADH-quinone oxidoreductase subunit E n=1 Tax=Nocardia pseudobrasiliensis TaxID=45979 RepID=A0A370IA70_9NOCA|nr:NADH-quinone oxidoreductase subunit NuoE [Nocardia pseudobrasiliensis]RDI67021.1 NADH-quinone oxidoreductase subunit E [Nocardia pseudobrasiliensis]
MTEILLKLGTRPIPYPQEVRDKLQLEAKEIIERYPQPRSALLPLLHLVQGVEGYVSGTGIGFCAEQLGLTDAEVTAVATFYSMYRRTPTGDYHVGVCTNTLCAVMGGDQIMADLTEHLGVGHGETTADGRVTLEHIECNAACDYAPVMMVNWEFFDNQTPESARALVNSLRRGDQVTGSRSGAPLCTFRETARVLAGFPDQRPDANEGEPGEATLAGLRIARSTAVPEQPVHHPGLAEKRGESREMGMGSKDGGAQ